MAVKNYYTMNGQIIGESEGTRSTDYILDGLGSVIATFRSTGTIQNQYRYSGYGQQVYRSGTGTDPYFLWVGGWGYRTRGMVYVRRRVFYEDAAVWTSVDPLWPDESAYRYVRNAPASRVDSSGLAPCPAPGEKCPDSLSGPRSALDLDLFTWWADGVWAGDKLKRIQECYNKARLKHKRKCKPLDASVVACLKESSLSTPVDCDCKKCYKPRQKRPCACDPPQVPGELFGHFPTARIHLCYPEILGPGCGNYGSSIDNVYLTLLHELLHTCGIDHGGNHNGEHSCNELLSCCIAQILNDKDDRKCY